MIANAKATNDEFLRDERDYINLLLSELDFVSRWIDSDLKIEYFEKDHQIILEQIQNSYYEGVLLTRKTFIEHLKSIIPVPNDRSRIELAFISCLSKYVKKGDYVGLESKIKNNQEHKRVTEALLNLNSKKPKDMGSSELAEAFRDTADIISPNKKPLDDSISTFLEQYIDFPVDAMPKILRPIIIDGSKAYTCPKDYIGVSMLTTLAGCIGRSHQIKISNTWIESPAIWSILIGNPSTVKSSFLRDISRIIYQKEYEWNSEYELSKEEYEKDKQIYEKELAKWKKDNNTNGDPPVKPKEPVQKCVIASDTTVEAIVQRMKDNPKGLIVVMDEIAGFFGGMNRYNMGSSDSEFYLQTWSGGGFKVDRKSTGTTVIKDTYLSLCGTIQPRRFRELLGGKYQDNGMAARILPCYPKPVKADFPTQSISDPNMKALVELYHKCMDLQLQCSEDWIDGADLKPQIVSFNEEGLQAFKDAFGRIVDLESKYAIDSQIEGLYGKMRGYLARFALVIHLIRNLSNEIQSNTVDAESVHMAEKLVYYFLAHTNKIWVSDTSSKYNDLYNKIRRYANKNKLKDIPVRKISQLKITKNTSELRDVIQYLSNNNLVVWCDDSKTSFQLN